MKNKSDRLTQAIRQYLLCSALASLTGCGVSPAPRDTVPHAQQFQATVSDSNKAEQHKDTDAVSNIDLQVAQPPIDQSSYALRSDARVLAIEIARTHDLNEEWVWSVMSKARYQRQAGRLIMPPPKGLPKNWAAYRARFVEVTRIRHGRAFWQDHRQDLERAAQTYGVPVEIILGILGVETMYGRDTGRFLVLDVLTTLALDFPKGRSDRSGFFKAELGAFIKLCAEQALSPTTTYGSFAGAIGWPQFMPSSIRRWGVDFDDDGKVDLQNSPVDAIGSIANYLAKHGWQKDLPTHFDVTPPSEPTSLGQLLAPDIRPTFSANQMQAMGAKLAHDANRHSSRLALVMLENGDKPPSFIAGTQNFYTITRYNQSSYYALAVIELGQALLRPDECFKFKLNQCT